VRLPASLAIDRKTTNDALTLGYSKVTGASQRGFHWRQGAGAVRAFEIDAMGTMDDAVENGVG
jgi:hypothetical protein